MKEPLLLDTCALIWLSGLVTDGARDAAEALLQETHDAGNSIFLSPISAWELGNSFERGRITLPVPLKTWFERVVRTGGLTWAQLTVDVLIQSTQLPPPFHRDPADRIIVATARELGLRILTRDRKILDYAKGGHVLAIGC
ncbi:MAG: type II toxin-antitoxin system VapC family toxin [Gemmobacter sp.]